MRAGEEPLPNSKGTMMHQLWSFEDCVERLGHSDKLVRSWALNSTRERFPRRYTPEVAGLLDDPDEHLACDAARYLGKHKAVEFAPAILKGLFSGNGNVPGNCASALGDMFYEPAVDQILEFLPHCGDANTFLGILHYLGRIHREDCHQALLSAFHHVQDQYFGDAAALCLLEHQDPNDVALVLDNYLRNAGPKGNRHLRKLLESVNGSVLFEDFVDCRGDLLSDPRESISAVIRRHAIIEPEPGLLDELSKMIESGQ